MGTVDCRDPADSYTQAEAALELVASEICDIIQRTRRESGLFEPPNMRDEYDQALHNSGHIEEARLYGVYHVVNDIRGFLRKAVEHHFFFPVMLMEGNEEYAEKIKEILQTCGVDCREVDSNYRSLTDFCECMGKIKRYITDLTVNGKRITKITPVSEHVVYGEDVGILILEDSDGQKSILKFVVGNNEKYPELLSAKYYAGLITQKELERELCDKFMSPLYSTRTRGGIIYNLRRNYCDPTGISCRLTHEGDILTSIEGIDGIPKIYARGVIETGDGHDLHYIVEQYLEGKNLVGLVETKNLPLQKIIQIISSLLRILSALHGKGYVHRDISVSNVLITDNAEIGLVDFGGAEPIASATSNEREKIIGTWPYIPPETGNFYDEEKFSRTRSLVDITAEIGEEREKAHSVYRKILDEGSVSPENREHIMAEFHRTLRARNIFTIWRENHCPLNPAYSAESDIYAVGILLYQLLKGDGRATDLDFGQVRLNNLTNVREGAGNQIANVIEKATRLDYRTRYKSADEMLIDLEQIQLV